MEIDLTRSIRVLTDEGLFLASAWGLAWGTRQVLMGNVHGVVTGGSGMDCPHLETLVMPGLVGQSIVAAAISMFLGLALCYVMVFLRRKIFFKPLLLGLASLLPIVLITTTVLPSMQDFRFPPKLLLNSSAFFGNSFFVIILFYLLCPLLAVALFNSDFFWVRLRRSLFFVVKVFVVCAIALKALFAGFELDNSSPFDDANTLHHCMFRIYLSVFLPIVAIYTTRKWLVIQEGKPNAKP